MVSSNDLLVGVYSLSCSIIGFLKLTEVFKDDVIVEDLDEFAVTRNVMGKEFKFLCPHLNYSFGGNHKSSFHRIFVPLHASSFLVHSFNPQCVCMLIFIGME